MSTSNASSDSEEYVSADEGLGTEKKQQSRDQEGTAPSRLPEGAGSGDEEESNRPQGEGSSEDGKNKQNGDDVTVEKGKEDIILATLGDGEKIQLFSVGAGEKGSEPEGLREQGGEGAPQEEAVSERRSSTTEQGITASAQVTQQLESTAREDLKRLPVAAAATVPSAPLLASPEEQPPVPPPRRKKKKKRFEKQASLEDLDQVAAIPIPRSATVGSVDFSRETMKLLDSLTGEPKSPTWAQKSEHQLLKTLSTEHESETPEASQQPPGFAKAPPKALPRNTSDENLVGSEGEEATAQMEALLGPGGLRPYIGRAEERQRASTPTIMIEPNTSLELTEDMMSCENEIVATATDTLLARARRATNPPAPVITPSDDESLEGDLNEGVDAGLPGEEEGDGAGIGGEGEEVDGGKSAGAGEGVPVGGERSKGTEPRIAHSPSDNQILAQTIVKNLDTGEVIPLSEADKRIPRGSVNPLSEHLIKRTSEMAASSMYDDEGEHRRRSKFKLKWRKRKEDRQLSVEGSAPSDDEATPTLPALEKDREQELKYKASSHFKGKQEFERVRLRQDLTGQHLGAVWVMEFSICGRLLATAGQDSVVRVWVLRTAYQFFHELQAKYQRMGVHSSGDSLSERVSVTSTTSSKSSDPDEEGGGKPFLDHPLCSYYGHTADILDITWSKNFFLLSSSMDKTVRLWHISRKECLCCFQHVDFVTAIAFHPRDDRYFLSGSLDGKLRLWNIPDKRVALWNEIEGVGSHLITAANFCMNGKFAVAGTYDGRCIFYDTEHLKYHTQIHVRSRHGKNRGRKISSVEPLPGEDKLLVTSNDSRVRLYNLKDHTLSCKYKGCLNTSSQIRATFSRDGRFIICGSEDNNIYIWQTHHDISKLSSGRRDRNEYYESFSAHSSQVTAAVFAPVPGISVDEGLRDVGQMMVAADYQGCIKVYVNSDRL